jgi:GAF domain-containing protein
MTMQSTFQNLLSPPIFVEDDSKTRTARYIHTLVLFSVPALVVFLLFRMVQGNAPFASSNLILLSLVVILLIVWGLTRSGAVRLAGYLYISTIWLASTLLALNGSGIRGSGFVSYFVVMLLAGLLLGVRAAIGIAVVSIISGFALAYAEPAGIITYTPSPAYGVAGEYTFLFFFGALFMYLTITSLQNALTTAKMNAKELQISNRDLTDLRDVLELRVQERTASLEKRASQIQTVSSMARAIAAVQDLSALLPNITNLVSEQFGFYHVGIFLLDEARKYAVLKAANSEGGIRMLNRSHRLLLNSNSIVGYVTSRSEPRIALDVGVDSVYFNNPDLPETRSEMALPLRVSGRVIGALDVQSVQTNAFSQEDISVLSTLADQIAIAIENARLFGEAQKALSDAQATYEKYVRQSWNSFVQQARHNGFVFDGKQVQPLEGQFKRDYVMPNLQTGSLSMEKVSETFAVPIKLRGQTIGFLDIRSKKGERAWTRDEINLLEAAADRAALALENARLVESAQRRAARERAIGDISTKIGAVNSFEYILQTAVEELGRKIGGATEVTLEIRNEDEQIRQQ